MTRFTSIPVEHAELIPVDSDDGLTLNLYRLRGTGTGRPVMLFGHACGFAAGSYLPLLSHLIEVADIFAFDARGHGGSDAPPADVSACSPDRHALDLARITRTVTAMTKSPLFYVGHSMGAAALLRLGSLHRDAFTALPWRGLLLFEPPIFPPPDHPEHAESLTKDRALVQRTAARRAQWPSREAFIAAMAERGPFRRVAPAFLAAHAAAALRPAARGDGVELCCSPAIEASTYKAYGESSTFTALAAFPRDVRLHLVGGDAADRDTRSWVTLLMPTIAAHLGLDVTERSRRRFTALADRGHLMPIEDAQMTCGLIHGLLSSR